MKEIKHNQSVSFEINGLTRSTTVIVAIGLRAPPRGITTAVQRTGRGLSPLSNVQRRHRESGQARVQGDRFHRQSVKLSASDDRGCDNWGWRRRRGRVDRRSRPAGWRDATMRSLLPVIAAPSPGHVRGIAARQRRILLSRVGHHQCE